MSVNVRNSGELTARQLRAVSLLVAGKSAAATGRELAVSERTVRRWLELEQFRDQLYRERSALMQAAAGELLSLASKATAALDSILDKPDQKSANIRRLTAVSVLSLLVDYRDLTDIEDRLLRLELDRDKTQD